MSFKQNYQKLWSKLCLKDKTFGLNRLQTVSVFLYKYYSSLFFTCILIYLVSEINSYLPPRCLSLHIVCLPRIFVSIIWRLVVDYHFRFVMYSTEKVISVAVVTILALLRVSGTHVKNKDFFLIFSNPLLIRQKMAR